MPRKLTPAEELDIELGLLIEELIIIKSALNNAGPKTAFKLIQIKEPSLKESINNICKMKEFTPNI